MVILWLLKCLSRGKTIKCEICEYETHASHTYQYKACDTALPTPTPEQNKRKKQTKEVRWNMLGIVSCSQQP